MSPVLEIDRLIEVINGLEKEYEGITAAIAYITSGIGIPTIDGMGMTGEAIHNVSERIYIKNIPFRVALLARMIQEI